MVNDDLVFVDEFVSGGLAKTLVWTRENDRNTLEIRPTRMAEGIRFVKTFEEQKGLQTYES